MKLETLINLAFFLAVKLPWNFARLVVFWFYLMLMWLCFGFVLAIFCPLLSLDLLDEGDRIKGLKSFRVWDRF